MKLIFAVVMLAFALGGCSIYGKVGKQTGVSSEVVRQQLGEPEHRYSRDDGEIWEYTDGRYGYYGYHYEFDTAGLLKRYVQTRTEKNVATVELNKATGDDVKAIIGWPVRDYVIRGNRIWEWPMMDKVGMASRLVVQFADDGTVSAVVVLALPTGSGRRCSNNFSRGHMVCALPNRDEGPRNRMDS